ncbi:MAG: hypothetical protein ABI644_09065 [Arenimonas sp.]
MEIITNSFFIGGLAGGLAVVIYGILQPRKTCPKCNQLLPMMRKPKTAREAVLGGWHCPKCNAKIDRKGALISS